MREIPTTGVRPEEVHIDPKEIPDVDYELGCRVLAASIRRILADPAKRAECEAWKAAREKGSVGRAAHMTSQKRT